MKAFKISNSNVLIHHLRPKLKHIDPVHLICILWMMFFSLIAILINYFYFHYHGNPFIQGPLLFNLSAYNLLYLGICHLVPELQRFKTKLIDLFYILFMYLIVQNFAYAIQFTPFQTIDAKILEWDPLPLTTIISWTRQHPIFQSHLMTIYASLSSCVMNIPFLILFLGKRKSIHDWIKFVFITVCLGFTFYYFFPSCGPASIISNKALFLPQQWDNTLKFQQIHQGLMPTTTEGGLIALPSYHIIWSWSLVRLLAGLHSSLFYLGILWFVGMNIACVCLGWHYTIDCLVSLSLIYVVEKYILTQNRASKVQSNLA